MAGRKGPSRRNRRSILTYLSFCPGSRIDRAGWVEAPRSIRQFAVLALMAVAWMMLFGLSRGGSGRFALGQMNRHLYLPFVFLLMGEALRGPVDTIAVGRIVLGAGVFRAAEAIILRGMFPSTDTFLAPTGGRARRPSGSRRWAPLPCRFVT